MWPGQGLSLKIKEMLYKGKSDFQVRFRWHQRGTVVHSNVHLSAVHIAERHAASCSRS